jgi:hypothetical protein
MTRSGPTRRAYRSMRCAHVTPGEEVTGDFGNRSMIVSDGVAHWRDPLAGFTKTSNLYRCPPVPGRRLRDDPPRGTAHRGPQWVPSGDQGCSRR